MTATEDFTLDISEARQHFTKLDERLRKHRVIWITRHHKKAFAVVDIEFMEALLETLDLLQDPTALQMLQQSFEDIREGRVYDHEDVKRELLSWSEESPSSGRKRPRKA